MLRHELLGMTQCNEMQALDTKLLRQFLLGVTKVNATPSSSLAGERIEA